MSKSNKYSNCGIYNQPITQHKGAEMFQQRRCQIGDTKQFSVLMTEKIRYHHRELSCPGDLAPDIWAPLS